MKKILVVDDERDVCDYVEHFFKERGYEVTIAFSGEDAIESIKKEKPGLIILDINMKGMDGIAALKHIMDIDRKLKVIMVTAYEEQDKMDAARKLGALDYITKPLALENLEETVDKHFK